MRLWGGALGALCTLAACTDGVKQPPPSASPGTAISSAAVRTVDTLRPIARVIVMPDLEGYLEPCGCQKRPLGGIDRAATALSELRGEGIPTAVVAGGSLLFEPAKPGHADDANGRDQEVWKAEALVGILSDLQIAAAAPGPFDRRFGDDTMRAVLETAEFPRLGAIAQGPAQHVLTVGGLKLGLLAVGNGEDTEASALETAAKSALARAQAAGAEVTLALVQAPPRLARRLATAVPGLNFVLVTGRDTDAAVPPTMRGGTALLSGSRHGRGLLVLDLFRGPGAPGGPAAFADMADASEWTRAEARAAAERQAKALAARVAEWEADPKVDAAQLATQKARLSELQAAAKAQPTALPSGTTSAFSARFVELDPDVARAPATRARLRAYDKRVNAHNRTALADWKPEPVPAGKAGYVGSAQCKSCHAPAYAWWQGHAHGRAYTTLVERDKQFNLSCVGCHVTGYLKPGGATVTHNEGLVHVGCESCHGPGSLHNGDPKGIVASPDRALCVECHNEEHSDQFEFDSYRARLLAPGHGLPTTPAPKQ